MAARRPTARRRIGAMIDPQPCHICGQTFDRHRHRGKKSEYCPPCRKNLNAGMTALITLDGRFMFLKADNDPQAQKLAGQVIKVMPETLDRLQQKQSGDGNESKNPA